MHTIHLTAAAHFPPGTVLGLTPAQVRPRRHALKALGGGAYEATQALNFKAGEHVDLVLASAPKSLTAMMTAAPATSAATVAAPAKPRAASKPVEVKAP